VVNLSLSVWLLKGFMDEIPREYEEAALVDGYTHAGRPSCAWFCASGYRHRDNSNLLPDLLVE